MKHVSLLIVAAIAQTGVAADYYVAPGGSDTNPGSRGKPFRTLTRARDSVRRSGKLAREPITIHVASGAYYLDRPLVLTAEDSGSREAPVIWRAEAGEEVRLVGGRPLDLKWKPHSDKVYKAAVPAGTGIDQLFLNGKRQILARYPNYDPEQRYYSGFGPTAERMKGWQKPETAYIHALHRAKWGSGHIVLKRDDKGQLYEYMVSIDTTTQGNGAALNPELRFVENVFEELDAPGEWFFDRDAGTLYFQPRNRADLDNALFEAVANPHLVRLKGTSADPVRFVTLDGFTFSGAAPTWKLTQDHLPNGGDFVVHRGGAMTLDGTEDCTVRDCSFVELGGNAVFINAYNRRATVQDCLIRNIGANGVALCGAAETMRGKQFFTVLDETFRKGSFVRRKWVAPEGWTKQPDDLAPGPKTEDYPSECLIKGNLITVSGELEKQSAGILLSMTMDNTISRNTVFKVPRAGICMNDCSWSGNVFEHNDVFDTVRETADHGPFNSWGKDRYWIWDNHRGNHKANPDAKKHCMIDAMKPNHVRNNRFSHPPFSTHSFGIDLDDGSTNFRIYDNLTLGCTIKFREGFKRTVENNIFICMGGNVPARHKSFPANGDVFRRNIVVNTGASTVLAGLQSRPGEIRARDHNCYFTPGRSPRLAFREGFKRPRKSRSIEQMRKELGQEENSIAADPMFVDPARGDYRVKPESPVLKLGFRNFPMEFGVTAPRLVRLLPKRTFPTMRSLEQQKRPRGKAARRGRRSAKERSFLGCTVKNMTEEAEKSAVGIGSITGVLILTLPESSPLARAGMREGDLIVACNGRKVHDFDQLLRAVREARGETVELQVHDDSRVRKYEIKAGDGPGN
jgi:parallel beta-helix repeat protein